MTETIKCRQDFVDECTEWCKKFINENKVIITYIRSGKKPKSVVRYVQTTTPDGNGYLKIVKQGRRGRCGVIAAYKGQDGVIRVGWSLCRKNEKFHRKIGLKYALERATNKFVEPLPHTVLKILGRFIDEVKQKL